MQIMNLNRISILFVILFVFVLYKVTTKINFNTAIQVGSVVDTFNGVNVYFNGGVNHVLERNETEDGYNIGLKYQCVEFVKRYYLEYYNHKMPDTFGHAKHFFDKSLTQGALNSKRGLKQYWNKKDIKPEVGDIVVYKPTVTNPYGHVAIISEVDLNKMRVEIIQQNPGPFKPSREVYVLKKDRGWYISNDRILGWLRL